MNKFFIILNTADSRLKGAAFEILSHIRCLYGTEAVIDAYCRDRIDNNEINKLGAYRVRKLYQPEEAGHDISKFYHHSETILKITADETYNAYICSANEWDNIVLSSVSASLNIDFYQNCIGQKKNDNAVILEKPLFGDKIIADIEVNQPYAASFRQKSFEAQTMENQGEGPEVIDFAFLIPSLEWVFEEAEENESVYAKRTELGDADIIVSVGRGLQDKNRMSQINELVDVFGTRACLGASRVVVDQGWAAFSHQVGQTGKIVSPLLYIALGISGAVQHQVGMNPAKFIISVNKDPDAAIFDISDYGIVDDMFEFLPKLIQELKKEIK